MIIFSESELLKKDLVNKTVLKLKKKIMSKKVFLNLQKASLLKIGKKQRDLYLDQLNLETTQIEHSKKTMVHGHTLLRCSLSCRQNK